MPKPKPNNIGDMVPPPPPQQNVPAVIPRELPGLSQTSLGPAPPVWTTNYDSVKQFYRPGVSQQRFPPLPTKSNPQINAQAASVATTVVTQALAAQAAAGGSTSDVEVINSNVQSGTSYLAQLSDRDTLISMTNNSGGFVTLPGSSGSFGFAQTAFGGGAGATALAPFPADNRLGNFLIAMSCSSPNGGPSTPLISDTNGNIWNLITIFDALGDMTAMWYADNIKGGPNTVGVTQPGGVQFCQVAVEEFSGILPGGIDQFGFGAGSAAITPTVANTAVFCSARDGEFLSNGQPTAGAGYTQTPFPSSQWNSTPEYISGIDEYLLNPVVGVSQSGTAVSGGIGAFQFIMANFRTKSAVNSVLPAGWFCYIENTGTGTFIVQSSANIDGSNQQIKLLPNTGVLVVSDGVGYRTQRGVAPLVKFETNSVLNSIQTTLNLVAGANIVLADLGGFGVRITGTTSGGPASQTLWNWPRESSGSSTLNPIAANNMNFTANQVKFMYIHVDVPLFVGNFTLNISTSSAHNYDWGMYTTGGVLLWNLGATVFGSTGQVTTPFSGGQITIQPGNYWLAFTGDGTGITFDGRGMADTEYFWFLNSATSTPGWWTSSTTSTGGTLTGLATVVPALPTTATNLTSPTHNTVIGTGSMFPIMCLSS